MHVQKAKEMGYPPQVILAGRTINDSVPRYLADLAIALISYGSMRWAISINDFFV